VVSLEFTNHPNAHVRNSRILLSKFEDFAKQRNGGGDHEKDQYCVDINDLTMEHMRPTPAKPVTCWLFFDVDLMKFILGRDWKLAKLTMQHTIVALISANKLKRCEH
jgi:hypothetical protein